MSSIWQKKLCTGKVDSIIRHWETKACQKEKWRIYTLKIHKWAETNLTDFAISQVYEKCIKKTDTSLCLKENEQTITKLDVKGYLQLKYHIRKVSISN